MRSYLWLPVPAREEAEEREHEDHDEDDPENAHALSCLPCCCRPDGKDLRYRETANGPFSVRNTQVTQKIAWTGQYRAAATRAAAGIVSTQATTMFPATPQRTAERRRVAPAPMTAPEMTCVVDRG